MKELFQLSFRELALLSLKEKVKVVMNYLDLIEQEDCNLKSLKIHCLNQLLDLTEKTELDFNNNLIYLIKGACFEYHVTLGIIPDIVVYQDCIWVGDSDFCLKVTQGGVSIPSYFVPPKGGKRIDIETIDFIESHLR